MQTFISVISIWIFGLFHLGLKAQSITSPAKTQVDTSYVNEVNIYMTRIDSLAHADKLQTGIIEGTITRTTIKASYNVKTIKNDTTWDSNKVGGFSIEPMFHRDTVYAILYHDNVGNNIYETYYFRNKQLICSKVRLEADGIGTVLYRGAEYYRNGKIVYAISPASEAAKELQDRVSFSWWETGNKYYEQVTK